MNKLYHIRCPKCNNIFKTSKEFYRYGKDKDEYQKYQCRCCNHQFAPDNPKDKTARKRKYPSCPKCGKASFLYHDHEHYINLKCGDKHCNHSFFVPKPTAIPPSSISSLTGKTDFKRMRFPVHVIVSALSMFNLGKDSLRNISLILRLTMNIKVSHTTVGNWCRKFAPMFHNMSLELMKGLDFNSDEWHAEETVVKINGQRYYVWFIIDSETRFILGFHLSPHRDSPQAFTLLNDVKKLGTPGAVVTDRYLAYKIPVKRVLGVKHIRVASFKDDISNNIIEAFNNRFKAWYKTKRGFDSFNSANSLISIFVFFFNFIRPHQGLHGLTPAHVAGMQLSKKERRQYLFFS